MATTPMFSPDGKIGDIPNSQVQAAVKAGFKLGVDMNAPNGQKGTIPMDKVHDAIKSGFTAFVPTEAQAQAHPPLADQNTPMSTSVSPQLVRATTDSLPAVGGMAGGVIASPGIVSTPAGVALGAGAGVEAKQLINRAVFGKQEPSTTSKQGLTEAGTQMAIQGGTEGVLGLAANAPAIATAWKGARAAKALDQSAKDFVTAVPPTKSAPYTPEDYQIARQYLEQEHAIGPSNKGSVESVRDAADAAIKNIEDQIGQHVAMVPNDKITTNVLQDVKSALSSNPRGQQFVDAGMKELEGLNLNNPTLQEADSIRRQLNAENKAVLKKNSYDMATARATDPGFAAREAAAESLRNGTYDQLAARGIGGSGGGDNISIQEMRQNEGSLIKVRNALQNQLLNGEKSISNSSSQNILQKVVDYTVPKGLRTILPAKVDAGINPPNLTRNDLLERSFGSRTSNAPATPSVSLRVPPETAPPPGTQMKIGAAPEAGETAQGSLFHTPISQDIENYPIGWSKERISQIQSVANESLSILKDPSATAAQKMIAREKLIYVLSANPGKTSAISSGATIGEQMAAKSLK